MLVFVSVIPYPIFAEEVRSINVMRGFSTPLKLIEDAATVAIGDPNLIGVVTIKPNLLMVNGQETGSTSLTVFSKSGSIYQYRVQIGNDIAPLRKLIESVEKRVTVEDINGTMVLKGEVATPAALTRILSIADRFVGGTAEPDFKVISDKGGVLSGNLDEKVVANPVQQSISVQSIAVGGRQGGGGNNSGGNNNLVNQPLSPAKGNLAQNISRGNVIMVANGRVMSLIKVSHQPKVEIQMRIVAVDRDKTDEFGIDWRLDGNRITVGSLLGGNVATLPAPPTNTSTPTPVNTGTANLVGFFNPGSYFISTFLRAIEEKGAAKTLSEPLLTAISGESASFLVGGNIPIPVQQAIQGQFATAAVATNVQYIQFGLSLVIRPTVLENGKISIVLDQSISQPDYSQSIQILGAQIPSFSQRSISTITESESGETWAVAGLLTEEDSKTLRSVPWISKVPIIGWLFKNTNNTTSRKELMILINAKRIDGVNQTTTSFDGVGDLAPTKTEPDVIEADTIKEQPKPTTPNKKPAAIRKEPIFNDKKNKVSSETNPSNLTDNATTRWREPTSQSLITPKPVDGRVYKEIANPNMLINSMNPNKG